MEDRLFKQISRQDVLVEEVVEEISSAILNGKLQPGDKLVEVHLAEQFGISRVPLREALRLLEHVGLVEKIPYRGTFVSRLDEHEIVELHSLRKVLEGMAARLLAEDPRPEALAALEALLARMRRVAEQGDRSTILVLDADFHDTLVKMSGHRLLATIWEPVSIKMRRFLFLKRHHTHKTIHDIVRSHERIVEGIRSGKGEAAEAAVAGHLTAVENRFMEAIQQGEPLT